jgi:hypothetical protein
MQQYNLNNLNLLGLLLTLERGFGFRLQIVPA